MNSEMEHKRKLRAEEGWNLPLKSLHCSRIPTVSRIKRLQAERKSPREEVGGPPGVVQDKAAGRPAQHRPGPSGPARPSPSLSSAPSPSRGQTLPEGASGLMGTHHPTFWAETQKFRFPSSSCLLLNWVLILHPLPTGTPSLLRTWAPGLPACVPRPR